jgi:hypothetical protein
MVPGTSHRFQRPAPVLLETETVGSGIYEQAALQPKASSVTVAVAIFIRSNRHRQTNPPIPSYLALLAAKDTANALLMKLRAPSCREFHLAALTGSLAQGSCHHKKRVSLQATSSRRFRWQRFEDLIKQLKTVQASLQ